MNPYGGYGPAQAIRDAGNSLADVMKGYMEMELLGKRVDLESKRLALEDRKAIQGLKTRALETRLASEERQADTRYREANLSEIARHNQAVEGETAEHHDALEEDAAARRGLEGRRVATEEGRLRIAQDEQARLNQQAPTRVMIEQSGLSSFAKKALLEGMSEEELNRVIMARDFRDGMLKQIQQNPKMFYQEMYAQFMDRKSAAEAAFLNAKTQEEAAEILEKQLLPTVSHMQNLKHVMGKGPELSTEDIQEAHDLAARVYERNPELFESLQDAQTQFTNNLSSARKQVHGKPGREDFFGQWREKNLAAVSADEVKANPGKYDPHQVADQIRAAKGDAEAKKFYELMGLDPKSAKQDGEKPAAQAADVAGRKGGKGKKGSAGAPSESWGGPLEPEKVKEIEDAVSGWFEKEGDEAKQELELFKKEAAAAWERTFGKKDAGRMKKELEARLKRLKSKREQHKHTGRARPGAGGGF